LCLTQLGLGLWRASDILAGTSRLRHQIESGESAETIALSWEQSVAAFERIRSKFLLY